MYATDTKFNRNSSSTFWDETNAKFDILTAVFREVRRVVCNKYKIVSEEPAAYIFSAEK